MVVVASKKRRTKLIRVYNDDFEDVKLKFPKVKMPDFFHVAVRSNPLIQVEAMLRGKKRNK